MFCDRATSRIFYNVFLSLHFRVDPQNRGIGLMSAGGSFKPQSPDRNTKLRAGQESRGMGEDSLHLIDQFVNPRISSHAELRLPFKDSAFCYNVTVGK